MTELRIGVRELRSNLTRYLNEAGKGTRILVTSREKVVAEIGAPTVSEKRSRGFGILKGKIKISENFDSWPDDILDSFER